MSKMKKIIAILLAVCFLVSITAASVSASSEEHHKKPEGHYKKFEHNKKHEKPEVTEEDEEEVTEEVVETFKEVEAENGVWKFQLIKYTKETPHGEKVWFKTKWKFVEDDDEE